MAFSTQSTRDIFQQLEGRWPAMGPSASRDAVERQIEELLAGQPAPVRGRLLEALVDPSREAFARTALSTLKVAASVGLRAVGWLGEQRLHCLDPSGRPVALAIADLDVPEDPVGSRTVVDSLRASLDTAFGERQYSLWLRRPMPEGVDTAAIGRAVTLWLAAIDRGEWQGRQAVYEDEGVEIELVLTGHQGRRRDTAQVFELRPLVALDRLSLVDAQVVSGASEHDQGAPEIPLVFAVGGKGPLGTPRGFCEQLLYGTADWTRSDSGDGHYEAAFPATGRSLFGDPLSGNVVAVWWFEPDPNDPLGFRCWSHENPWTRASWCPDPPAGPRFHRVSESTGASGRRVDVMRWTGRPGRGE